MNKKQPHKIINYAVVIFLLQDITNYTISDMPFCNASSLSGIKWW